MGVCPAFPRNKEAMQAVIERPRLSEAGEAPGQRWEAVVGERQPWHFSGNAQP